MVDAVNIIGTSSTAAALTPQPSAVPVPATGNAAKAAVVASSSTQNYDYFASRVLSDPTSGVLISEQFDSKGNVTSQNPGGIVLAYLRNGLTASGSPKQSLTA